MSADHGPRSPRWKGNPRAYQAEAQRLYSMDREYFIMPWSWITTDCDVDMCLDTECMTIHAPKRIAYPYGICVYCGETAGTKDHLLPKPMTGLALRHLVAVVPACGNCNSRIGDFPSPNVNERRRRAQLSIERSSKTLLLRGFRDGNELKQLGPGLRRVAVKNNALYLLTRRRLAWPVDPHYDIRAFEHSGIEDPVVLGLCEPLAKPLRSEYAA